MNQEGSTLLKARVDQNGQVVQVQIVASSGYPVLDEAAQQAVQTWRFAPAQKNGEAIPSWVSVPINFSLR
ncbi:MAG: energy transducer TonB [Synechococcaceae cyanobacterium SM2_3_1]|nr:energy transducer TonB [Synechococcaceae cyanobacterium SM2_3_1]